MAEISSAGEASPATVSRGRATWERLVARIDLNEVALVLSLVVLSVAVRLLRLQPIEYYDDEVMRWNFVRQWFHDNSFRHGIWTHHMARFGINVPLFFAQLLFGRHASVYYVWPIASFALQVAFVYLTARRLGGRGAGVVAAILLSVFTGIDRGASQILPDAFGATALVVLSYLLTRYHDASSERRMPWLFGAAAAFIWAYLIKESNLLFLPGAALGVWLLRGRFRDGVWFTLLVFGFIALETLGFRLLTDYSSRFAIVGEAHGDIRGTTFWGLFDRFTRLEPAWQMLVWTWAAASIWIVGSSDKRARVVVLLPAAFLFFLTFLVRSLDPLVIWTRFYSRYFEPTTGLMTIAIGLFVHESLGRAWRERVPERVRAWFSPSSRFGAAPWIFACLLVGLVEYGARDPSQESALAETRRISRIVNDTYRRNLPIVMQRSKRREHEERRVRPLKLIYGVYLNEAQIMSSPLAKQGALPDMLEVVKDSKKYSYVLHDPAAYAQGQVEEWVERGCALVVTEAKKHLLAAPGVPSLIVERTEKLPANCEPPAR